MAVAPLHSLLCRRQLGSFERALAEGGSLVVACTAEAPLFEEVAEEAGRGGTVRFVNIRETAGWSEDGGAAGPEDGGAAGGGSNARRAGGAEIGGIGRALPRLRCGAGGDGGGEAARGAAFGDAAPVRSGRRDARGGCGGAGLSRAGGAHRGQFREVRGDGGRLCAAPALGARGAGVRGGKGRGGVGMQPDPRSLGRHAAGDRGAAPRRLFPRRSGGSGGGAAGGVRGERHGRQFREADLCRLQRRDLRAFALDQGGLHEMSRCLSGGRDRLAGRSGRGDRCGDLRRLRGLCGALSDRVDQLPLSAARGHDRAGAGDAGNLSRGGRRGRSGAAGA